MTSTSAQRLHANQTLWALLASLMLVGLAGCGESVGTEGDVVGGPCLVHQDCADGSTCLNDGDFPGGMCSLSCTAASGCPSGSACIDKKGGYCLPSCSIPQDCRIGYICKYKKQVSGLGETPVCIKD